jgi:ubiquinone/menaquinone biosynthesis C-methylase UbiE
MKEPDQEKVLREVRRVLAPSGRFLIWDVELPVRPDPNKEVALYRFRFQLPGKEVKTGYGTMFPDKPHDMSYFAALAEKAGLRVESRQQQGRVLTLTLSR